MITMPRKAYQKLNCKIYKLVSNKLEKFIADIQLSKTVMVKKVSEKYINKYNKSGKI